MIGAVLLQVDALTEVQRAVRDRFQQGGSILPVLLVIAVLVGTVLFGYWLNRRQERRDETPVRIHDPQQLFGDLLQRLPLTAPQRRSLSTVVTELELKHPSVILLSPSLFERQIDRWRAMRHSIGGNADRCADDELLARARDVLFPRPPSPLASE